MSVSVSQSYSPPLYLLTFAMSIECEMKKLLQTDFIGIIVAENSTIGHW